LANLAEAGRSHGRLRRSNSDCILLSIPDDNPETAMGRRYPFPIVVVLLPLLAGGCASTGPHKEVINPDGGPVTTPFSPVVRTGDLLFLSGVIGRDPEGDIGAATRQALERIRARLAAAGATLDDVVKCTVFLVDMADYGAMNAAYSQFFPSDPPARSAVAVRGLPADAQVEIECIAAAR
jgi:2-iminobutanoate/2-iminopropanoate deaminase